MPTFHFVVLSVFARLSHDLYIYIIFMDYDDLVWLFLPLWLEMFLPVSLKDVLVDHYIGVVEVVDIE